MLKTVKEDIEKKPAWPKKILQSYIHHWIIVLWIISYSTLVKSPTVGNIIPIPCLVLVNYKEAKNVTTATGEHRESRKRHN